MTWWASVSPLSLWSLAFALFFLVILNSNSSSYFVVSALVLSWDCWLVTRIKTSTCFPIRQWTVPGTALAFISPFTSLFLFPNWEPMWLFTSVDQYLDCITVPEPVQNDLLSIRIIWGACHLFVSQLERTKGNHTSPLTVFCTSCEQHCLNQIGRREVSIENWFQIRDQILSRPESWISFHGGESYSLLFLMCLMNCI